MGNAHTKSYAFCKLFGISVVKGEFAMPKIFSVASWNVEHFKNDTSRVKRVAQFISGQNGGPVNTPDIFALFEVEGKYIFQEFMNQFPDYRFHLTEGKQSQEIFIGVHKKLQSFSTQRLEFKTKREFQRPGLLLTVRINDTNYTLLFLHIRSGSNTEDFGLRDAALIHAFNLKKALDEVQGNPSNYVFLGDLNTMGIDDPVPYSKILDFSAEDEIDRIAEWSKKRKMMLLKKETTNIDGQSKEVTWYNGSSNYKPTNLDHVIASEHMDVRSQQSVKNTASLFGWPKLNRSQWNSWFSQYSDHAMLYFEIWS